MTTGPADAPTVLERVRARSAELFDVLRGDTGSDVDRARARDELAHLHLPLVEHCARRFRNRGEPFEDLVQVGTIGLIKAVDRFEVERGLEFSTYATPTVIGEVKRHFRDKGWAIRVSRRLQELRMQIGTATAELTQQLAAYPPPRARRQDRLHGGGGPGGYRVQPCLRHVFPGCLRRRRRRPTQHAGLPGPCGRQHRACRGPRVDQAPLGGAGGAREADPAAALLQEHDPVPDRRGDRVSQMHVSRLLSRTLSQFRSSLEAD